MWYNEYACGIKLLVIISVNLIKIKITSERFNNNSFIDLLVSLCTLFIVGIMEAKWLLLINVQCSSFDYDVLRQRDCDWLQMIRG